MATEMSFQHLPVLGSRDYFDIKLVTGFIFVLAMATWSFFLRGSKGKSGKGRLPPGPVPLPIIGNFHQMGKLPHRALAELSKKYGPLISVRFCSNLTLVASSPDMAKEFLKINDRVFSSRHPPAAAKYLTYDCSDVAFAPYGHYWRQMRKICVLQMFNTKRVESFHYIREEETTAMIRSLKNSVGDTVNVTNTVFSLVKDIVCRMAFGRKYSDQDLIGDIGFATMVKEIVAISGCFNIGDFIPFFAWLDLQGISRQFKKLRQTQDAFFDKVIDEHIAEKNASGPPDLVDVLLEASADETAEFRPSRDNIKAVILDILTAGTDTSSSTLDWAMVELFRNPSVMKKLQDELEHVVGFDRMVSESDLANLIYLRAVVKETLRLHPPAPFIIPHASDEDCNALGYQIPKGTRLLVNLWQIGRNTESWGEDAESFKPERFMEDGFFDAKIQNFEWIPFGAGRRGCPGQQMGTLFVEFATAQLVHCFNWKLPNDMDPQKLDMSENFAFTMCRTDDLFAVPTLRFPLPV